MSFDFAAVQEILVCPYSKTTLVHDGDTLICTDSECRRQYEIRDDIPIMLVDNSTELSTEEWEAAMKRTASPE